MSTTNFEKANKQDWYALGLAVHLLSQRAEKSEHDTNDFVMFLSKHCCNKVGFRIQRSCRYHRAEGEEKKNRRIRRELQLIWKESLLIIWDEWAETQNSIFSQYFGRVWALYLKGFLIMSLPSTFLRGSPLQMGGMNLWLETFFTVRFERRLYNPKFHIAADILEKRRIKKHI